MMSHAWPIVLRGGLLSPRGYGPLYGLMIVSHRVLRYAAPALHVADRRRGAAARARAASTAPALAAHAALLAGGAGGRRRALAAAAAGALLRADHRRARRRALRPPAPRHAGGLGRRRRARGELPRQARARRRARRRRRCCSAAPLLGVVGGADPARVARAPDLPPAPRRPRRRAVRALQAAHDGHRRRAHGRRAWSSTPATRASPASARGCAATRSTSCPTSSTCSRARCRSSARARRCRSRSTSYSERQRGRLDVRPGITGWAQVNGRASLPWHERIELDLWYVEHASLALDLRIMWLSLRMVFGGHGLYRGETGGWRAAAREALGNPLRALVDVAGAERPDRVEDLVVHLRAGDASASTPSRRPRLHAGRVLEQQHVVAVVVLGQQRLELVDGRLRRARLVLDLDPAVLERVHGLAEVRRVAGGVDAVLVPVGRVVARGRRVRLVVRGLEVLLLVVGALVGGVVERAAGGLGGLLDVGDLLGRQLRASRRRLLRLAVAVAAAVARRARPRRCRRSAARASSPPKASCMRLRRAARLASACSRSSRSWRRRSFSSCRLDTSGEASEPVYPTGVSCEAMQTDATAIQNRLRRIEGQVRGLQRMVGEDAYCVDILTQVSAVQTALEQVSVRVLDGHVRHCVADAVAGRRPRGRRGQARRADGRRAALRQGPLAAARAGARVARRGFQHSSMKSAISPVRRSGASRSSTIELATSSRALGSSSASVPASLNGCTRIAAVPDHERRRCAACGARAVRGDAAEEQALQHGGARRGVLADGVDEEVGRPRQPRHLAGADAGRRASSARRSSARPSAA